MCIYNDDEINAKALTVYCEKFVKENRITRPETVEQSAHVMENAVEFIKDICDHVGWHKEGASNE